jgi:type IV pilus assembly protein PilN
VSLRRINLLPPEERRRRRPGVPATTRSTLIGALLGVAGLAVLLMVGLYLFYFVRLGNERDQISQLRGETARLQAEVADLAPFRDLQARLDAKKSIADGIWRTRFPWDEFLRDLQFVIPDTTALDSFVAVASPVNVNVPPVEPPEVEDLEPTGTISFSGVALPEYRNVSDFVVRMNNLRYLANADLTTAELDRETFVDDAITFEVNADLVTRVGDDGNEVPLEEEPAGDEGPTGQPLPDDQAGAVGAQYGSAQYAAQYGGAQ